MNLQRQILQAYRYLFFCHLEHRLRQGFQSIWFWLPLCFWNYSEFYFPYLGIGYVGIILAVLLKTRRFSLKPTHGAYFLDRYYRTQGEISAWYESPKNFFAPLLEASIQKYPRKRLPVPPIFKLLLWSLPTILLLSIPIFRSSNEWDLLRKKQQLREQLERMESTPNLHLSFQDDLKMLREQLEAGSATWAELLKQMQQLEEKATQQIALSLSEQKLLEQIFKQVPEFQEWLEKKAPELNTFLEKEKIPETLQEKIWTSTPEELRQALQQSQQIQTSLLNALQSFLPPKITTPEKKQTPVSSVQEIPLVWGEETIFPEVPASPKFRELLEHLGSQ